MENPTGWNLLTSCLTVCDLDDADASWEFLLEQTLVHPAGRDSFDAALAERMDPDQDTMALSRPLRLGGNLNLDGISTDAGMVPDPWARDAARKFLDWTLSRCPAATSRSDGHPDGYLLVCRDEVTGPFDIDELHAMSSRGELHDFCGVRVRGQWQPLLPHGFGQPARSTPWSYLMRRIGLDSGPDEDWIAPLDYAFALGGIRPG